MKGIQMGSGISRIFSQSIYLLKKSIFWVVEFRLLNTVNLLKTKFLKTIRTIMGSGISTPALPYGDLLINRNIYI